MTDLGSIYIDTTKQVMDEATFNAVRLLFLGWSILLLAYAGFWRRRAGKAYYYSAVQNICDKEKKELAMRGVLAGNKNAAGLYALMQPDEFSPRHPHKPFRQKGVRCVFGHYYYPKRYERYLNRKQRLACQNVLDFKDGQVDGVDFFSSGISLLAPNPKTVVLFMPCSAEWKYRKRFKGISNHIRHQCPDLTDGISYLKYTGERQSLHLQKGRANIQLERNYELTGNLKDREVIIVDDLLTTGKSLQAFKEEVEKKGGKVIGAIFAACTFEMPTRMEIFIHALLCYWKQRNKTA